MEPRRKASHSSSVHWLNIAQFWNWAKNDSGAELPSNRDSFKYCHCFVAAAVGVHLCYPIPSSRQYCFQYCCRCRCPLQRRNFHWYCSTAAAHLPVGRSCLCWACQCHCPNRRLHNCLTVWVCRLSLCQCRRCPTQAEASILTERMSSAVEQ